VIVTRSRTMPGPMSWRRRGARRAAADVCCSSVGGARTRCASGSPCCLGRLPRTAAIACAGRDVRISVLSDAGENGASRSRSTATTRSRCRCRSARRRRGAHVAAGLEVRVAATLVERGKLVQRQSKPSADPLDFVFGKGFRKRFRPFGNNMSLPARTSRNVFAVLARDLAGLLETNSSARPRAASTLAATIRQEQSAEVLSSWQQSYASQIYKR